MNESLLRACEKVRRRMSDEVEREGGREGGKERRKEGRKMTAGRKEDEERREGRR